jgi:hypothetical protein
MNIATLALIVAIGTGPINSDPCPARWQDCAIPWPIPLVPYVPDVEPIDIDLEPAEDVEGPELDDLPELSVPELTIPESLDVPEFPPIEPEPGESGEDISDQVELWMAPVINLQAALENWIGETGSLPDASDGDFETGFDPVDDEHTTAFEFASDLGTSIATLFDYVRALSGLTSYSIGTLILFVIGCAAWLALNRFIVFALSIADMLWSIFVQGIQALGEALPWPW